MFIVQAQPREPAGMLKVIKETRAEALATAKDFLDQGIPSVTIIDDGRFYTAREFGLTVLDDAGVPSWSEAGRFLPDFIDTAWNPECFAWFFGSGNN